MNRSGRFDFWGMLLHTRAITPPSAASGFRVQMMKQISPGWLVLSTILVVGVGAALYVSNLQSVAVKQSKIVAVPSPGKPPQLW
jgi:hypothetical protein